MQVRCDLLRIISKLGVEVFSVRASAHGGTEDRLDQEAMVRLECCAVGGSERVGKLLISLGDVLAESNAGEFKTSMVVKSTVSMAKWGGRVNYGDGHTELTTATPQ